MRISAEDLEVIVYSYYYRFLPDYFREAYNRSRTDKLGFVDLPDTCLEDIATAQLEFRKSTENKTKVK